MTSVFFSTLSTTLADTITDQCFSLVTSSRTVGLAGVNSLLKSFRQAGNSGLVYVYGGSPSTEAKKGSSRGDRDRWRWQCRYIQQLCELPQHLVELRLAPDHQQLGPMPGRHRDGVRLLPYDITDDTGRECRSTNPIKFFNIIFVFWFTVIFIIVWNIIWCFH